MDKSERLWFGVLILVAVALNAITLSPLVPWQSWMLWSPPTPDQRVPIEVADYQFRFPPQGIRVAANKYVEFAATSKDVTYGFGVFRQDGTMVFQMQVVPRHTNTLLWKFDTPGVYDVRSTEYSGPKHSDMWVKNAIRVSE